MYGSRAGVERKYIAVDVETTGLSPRYGARIIEIAAVSLTGGTAEFQSLINPGVAIPENARRVHGISNNSLRGQPGPDYVYGQLREFIGDGTLIAHNAGFDMVFLRAEFKRCGLELRNQSVCTLALSRRCLPGLPNYKLATVYKKLFGELSSARSHRALADARMAARIWQKLMGFK